MLFGYDYFYNVMKKNVTEKIDSAVYGMWRGHIFLELFITFVIANFFYFALFDFHVLRYVIMFLVYIIYIFIVSSRRIGLCYSKDAYTYIKLKAIVPTAKEVDYIPTKNIKYISVKSLFFRNYVTMSYISEDGRLKKIRIIFNDFVIGFSITKQRENSTKILKELRELQKVLDRGDF